MSTRVLVLAAMSLALGSGCAEEIGSSTNDTPSSNSTASNSTAEGLISHTDMGDGTFVTQVHAVDEAAWVYLNLEDRAEVTVSDPFTSLDWDLGFQRFRIKTNGGISGSGGMGVAVLPGEDFEALSQAPSSGYIEDDLDSDDVDSDEDLAFLGPEPWYNYDPTQHTLSPDEVVYVVRTVENNYYKVQMLDYYNEAGTSGHPQFRWGSIEPPEGGETQLPEGVIEVDASAPDTWIYLTAAGRVVSADTPEESGAWDLAFNRTQLRTNSGTSGIGLGGAVESEAAFDAITAAPTVGFVVDAMLPLPGPPGSGEFSGNPVLNTWYDYDSATQTVSPRDVAYIVRTAGGGYARLRIESYTDGVYRIGIAPMTDVAPDVHEAILSPGAEDEWTYLDLTMGTIGTDSETAWDVAVQRTLVQTNSGTSGSGSGGAIELEEASALADIPSAPSPNGCYLLNQGHVCDCEMTTDVCSSMDGIWTDQCGCGTPYTVDEMIALPGPPGSGEFSGNPVLNTWYDYDDTTHIVSPRDTVFVVRTADGTGYAKFKVVTYDDGSLGVTWSYSGPGRTQF